MISYLIKINQDYITFTCGTSVSCITSQTTTMSVCVSTCLAIGWTYRGTVSSKKTHLASLKWKISWKQAFALEVPTLGKQRCLFPYKCYSISRCIHLDNQQNRHRQCYYILHCSYNAHCKGFHIHSHNIQVCILYWISNKEYICRIVNFLNAIFHKCIPFSLLKIYFRYKTYLCIPDCIHCHTVQSACYMDNYLDSDRCSCWHSHNHKCRDRIL